MFESINTLWLNQYCWCFDSTCNTFITMFNIMITLPFVHWRYEVTSFRQIIQPLSCTKRWVKSFYSTEYSILTVWFISYFYALTFILQDTLALSLFSVHSHSYYKFYFEVTIFIVEKIVVVNTVSQVVIFILIQSFWSLYINTKINNHTIGYYC